MIKIELLSGEMYTLHKYMHYNCKKLWHILPNQMVSIIINKPKIIVLKPDQAGRSGIGTELGWRKNKKSLWLSMTWRLDPAKPGQKLDCNLLIFFLSKRRRFDFFKNRNWPGRPGQNLESRFWTGPGLKIMPETTRRTAWIPSLSSRDVKKFIWLYNLLNLPCIIILKLYYKTRFPSML